MLLLKHSWNGMNKKICWVSQLRVKENITSTYLQNNTKWVEEWCEHHAHAMDATDRTSALIIRRKLEGILNVATQEMVHRTILAEGWVIHTGISVKRASKALDVKHSTQVTVKQATC